MSAEHSENPLKKQKINKACLFLIFTFSISYLLAAIFWLIKGNFNFQVGFIVLGVIYMFIPFISALIVKKIYKEKLLSNLLISFKINRWFFFAWLIFPVIIFCSLGITLLFPDISYNPELTGILDRQENVSPEMYQTLKDQINALPVHYFWVVLLQGLIAGITINAIAAFGEETGWRGFLLKEFKDMHFLKAAVYIGAVWGIWHAPLILMGHNYPQHPVIGVFMMVVFCILLTPIMQYIAVKSKSVIAAAIAHGTMNAVAGISIIATSGGNDLITGITGLPGFITLIIFTAGIFVYDNFISKEKIMINKMSNYIFKGE